MYIRPHALPQIAHTLIELSAAIVVSNTMYAEMKPKLSALHPHFIQLVPEVKRRRRNCMPVYSDRLRVHGECQHLSEYKKEDC